MGYIFVGVRVSVCLSVCLRVCLAVCLCVYLSACLSGCVSVCLSVCRHRNRPLAPDRREVGVCERGGGVEEGGMSVCMLILGSNRHTVICFWRLHIAGFIVCTLE